MANSWGQFSHSYVHTFIYSQAKFSSSCQKHCKTLNVLLYNPPVRDSIFQYKGPGPDLALEYNGPLPDCMLQYNEPRPDWGPVQLAFAWLYASMQWTCGRQCVCLSAVSFAEWFDSVQLTCAWLYLSLRLTCEFLCAVVQLTPGKCWLYPSV